MGAGTMSDPEKGYDLEFVLESATMAAECPKMPAANFATSSIALAMLPTTVILYMRFSLFIAPLLWVVTAKVVKKILLCKYFA